MEFQNEPNYSKFEKLFSHNIFEMNQVQLAILREDIKKAIQPFETLSQTYHILNPEVRHTSQCMCGLSEFDWSCLDHGKDWLVDIDSQMGF